MFLTNSLRLTLLRYVNDIPLPPSPFKTSHSYKNQFSKATTVNAAIVVL